MIDDFKLIVHHELYLYLSGSRDDYWVDEGDEIHVYKFENGWYSYEVNNYHEVGVFPEYFLDPTNSYYEWLENR